MARTAKTPESKAPEPGFDKILERLREVVEKLEGGKLTLEESLAAYEEGVTLTRSGHTILDKAEKRVELLVNADGDGVDTEPLDEQESDQNSDQNSDGGAPSPKSPQRRGRTT